MVAADPCAELQELRRQYESALRAWAQYPFPLHNAPVGTRAWRSEQLQLEQRALEARNAAHHRVLDHKLVCPLCGQPLTFARFRREIQAMAESDQQLKYRKEVNERQKNWQDSINRGASGESKAQLLRQIDAAEKLLEAIKTFKRECDSTTY
jgi:DNA repair exonuclease SbcCD ATPase subunit